MQKKTAKRKANAKKLAPAKVVKKSPAIKKSKAVKKSRKRPAALPKGEVLAAPVSPGGGLAATKDGGVRSLPPRQQMFVAEYLANGMNATQAAIKAGYSAKTAESQACRLLRNVKVAEEIGARAEKVLAKREITAERVLDEIAKMAFFDPRKLFRADGALVPIAELDEECAAAIAGVDVKELFGAEGAFRGLLKKIKLADKGANLERLGRYLKLFTDKVVHSFDLSDLDDAEIDERLAKLGVKKK